jgi:N-acetylglutamate synthase-like GNAT family acetyltransferase
MAASASGTSTMESQRMTEIRPLTQVAELDALRRLGIEAGLEPGDDRNEDIVAAWGAFEGAALVGGIALETHHGLDLVGWLAVGDSVRGRGIGRRLLGTLEDEARRRRIGELWATARAPGFFIRNGYAVAGGGAERELLLPGCFDCEQYEETCHPKIVKKGLETNTADAP